MNKQAGFTLIEIIAVLVILGILAAVAIPKYQDLQEQAEAKAAQGLVAACLSQMTMTYSRSLLQNDGDATVAAAAANADNCSDVEVSANWTVANSGGTVTATGPTGQTSTGTWTAP